MRRLKPFLIVLGLVPLLAGCGLPGAVAHGVKSVQRGLGIGEETAPAQQPAPQPDRTATEPPPPQPAPPVAVQRDPVKVEELR